MAQITVICHECAKPTSSEGHLSFREECVCGADLHVCFTCKFYDSYVENQCREPTADPVSEKARRNLCEYWKPKTNAASGDDDDVRRAKEKLNALFGDVSPQVSSSTNDPKGVSPTLSPEDEAKRKLEALFKKKS